MHSPYRLLAGDSISVLSAFQRGRGTLTLWTTDAVDDGSGLLVGARLKATSTPMASILPERRAASPAGAVSRCRGQSTLISGAGSGGHRNTLTSACYGFPVVLESLSHGQSAREPRPKRRHYGVAPRGRVDEHGHGEARALWGSGCRAALRTKERRDRTIAHAERTHTESRPGPDPPPGWPSRFTPLNQGTCAGGFDDPAVPLLRQTKRRTFHGEVVAP